MPEDTIVAAPEAAAPAAAPSVPATESHETSEPAAAPERTGSTRQDRIDRLTGKARERYRMTGELPVEANFEPGASSEAQTEPEPGPGGQPPKPDTRTRQDRNFRSLSDKASKLERDLAVTQAKLEVYERERAASRPSAPTAPLKELPALDDRPEFPDIANYSGEEGLKKFQADVKKWKNDDAKWIRNQMDARLTGQEAKATAAKATETWNGQVNQARTIHKDFDAVAFSGSTPLSFATLQVLQGLPDGALRSYALGKNLELANKIAELTHVPGENKFQGANGYAQFIAAIRKNPDLALLYGEKLATAKAELAKLQVGKGKPASTTLKQPLKEAISAMHRPSAEIETQGSASPVQDPVHDALKRGDFKSYKKLMNDQDLRKRR